MSMAAAIHPTPSISRKFDSTDNRRLTGLWLSIAACTGERLRADAPSLEWAFDDNPRSVEHLRPVLRGFPPDENTGVNVDLSTCQRVAAACLQYANGIPFNEPPVLAADRPVRAPGLGTPRLEPVSLDPGSRRPSHGNRAERALENTSRSAWATGSPTEAALTAHIDVGQTGRLVISRLPPDCTTGEIAEAIQTHVEWARRRHGTGEDDHEAEREPTPPSGTCPDDSTRDGARLVDDLRPGADTDAVRRFVATIWGVRRRIAIDVGVPIPDLIRGFSHSDPDTLDERLTLIERAIQR